ncbi:MAG: DEAD/DEAH box helicase [Saprospiraceae bacterium]
MWWRLPLEVSTTEKKNIEISMIFQFVVLDEADEMLNMGFIEDIEEILSHCPEERADAAFFCKSCRSVSRSWQKIHG